MADAVDNEAITLAALRDTDIDRYLAVLLSPPDKRRALTALYAFHAELARVRDLVREPLPGEVRLQYWRDLLEGAAHGSTDANPLASELLDAIRAHGLPVAPLVAMTEARIFDLYDDPIDSLASLQGYAGETASALIQLASLVLDPESAAASAEMAGHAGVAQAIAGALVRLPRHRQRGQVFLPPEILGATGLDRDAFLEDGNAPRIAAAVEAFAGLGLDHLARARQNATRVPNNLMPAYLPVSLARGILSRAAGSGEAALKGILRPAQWRRQLSMISALWLRRF
nr:phytoene/squalene synthase family protein [uncultured Gellertiella sp.]